MCRYLLWRIGIEYTDTWLKTIEDLEEANITTDKYRNLTIFRAKYDLEHDRFLLAVSLPTYFSLPLNGDYYLNMILYKDRDTLIIISIHWLNLTYLYEKGYILRFVHSKKLYNRPALVDSGCAFPSFEIFPEPSKVSLDDKSLRQWSKVVRLALSFSIITTNYSKIIKYINMSGFLRGLYYHGIKYFHIVWNTSGITLINRLITSFAKQYLDPNNITYKLVKVKEINGIYYKIVGNVTVSHDPYIAYTVDIYGLPWFITHRLVDDLWELIRNVCRDEGLLVNGSVKDIAYVLVDNTFDQRLSFT